MRKSDYSSIASYYDEVRPEPAAAWIKAIVKLAGIGPESRVLDVGCGTGRFAVMVRQYHDGESYGVDSSVKMLERAATRRVPASPPARTPAARNRGRSRSRHVTRKRARPIHWVAGDAHSLPLKSGSVDCAYMTMVMHHIQRPAMALKEIRRVLRPGGTLLVMTTSHAAIRAHVLRHFPGVVATDLKRFPTIPALRAAVKKAGFKNVRSRSLTHCEPKITVERYLDMVRNKYLSTFTVMDEHQFERGLKIFERRLPRICGETITRPLTATFVIGER